MSRFLLALSTLAVLNLLGMTASDAAACPAQSNQVRYVNQPSAVHRVVRTYVFNQPSVQSTASATPIAPVAPAAAPQSSNQLTVGATIMASANFLGNEKGHVLLHLGTATIACEVVAWQESSAAFKLPALGLQQPTNAQVDLVRPDGRLVRSFRVQLVTPPEFAEIGEFSALSVTPSNVPASPSQTAATNGAVLTSNAAEAGAIDVAAVVVE